MMMIENCLIPTNEEDDLPKMYSKMIFQKCAPFSTLFNSYLVTKGEVKVNAVTLRHTLN